MNTRDLEREKHCTGVEDLFPYPCTWSTKANKQKQTNSGYLKKIKTTESNYTKL